MEKLERQFYVESKLRDLSNQEVLDEISRRQQAEEEKNSLPHRPCANNSPEVLQSIIDKTEHILNMHGPDSRSDFPYYDIYESIFGTVMQSIYGKQFWSWWAYCEETSKKFSEDEEDEE